MLYNKNAGYGQAIGQFPFSASGKVFVVGDSGTANRLMLQDIFDLDPDGSVRFFSTIDAAIGACTANAGDKIYVAPGHTETVTAAAGIAADIAGISIIGIGKGSDRPTINFTTAVSASFKISAANITVENLLFTGGIDALTNPIHIDAADATLRNIETKDVTGQATDFILTTANADRLTIEEWIHDGAVAAGANSALAIVGGDRITVKNFFIDGDFAVSAIDIRTTATTDIRIYGDKQCFMRTRNAADILIKDTITASTGFVGPNINGRLQDNAANITEAFTGATFVYMQPLNLVNLAGESSMQSNITASTDA